MALVDTGAMRSLITIKCFHKYQNSFGELQPLTTRVQGATGERLGMYGQTRPLQVQVGKAWAPSIFLVMQGERTEAILGMDVLEAVGAVVNLDQNTLLTRESQSCPRCASRVQNTREAVLAVQKCECPQPATADLSGLEKGDTHGGVEVDVLGRQGLTAALTSTPPHHSDRGRPRRRNGHSALALARCRPQSTAPTPTPTEENPGPGKSLPRPRRWSSCWEREVRKSRMSALQAARELDRSALVADLPPAGNRVGKINRPPATQPLQVRVSHATTIPSHSYVSVPLTPVDSQGPLVFQPAPAVQEKAWISSCILDSSVKRLFVGNSSEDPVDLAKDDLLGTAYGLGDDELGEATLPWEGPASPGQPAPRLPVVPHELSPRKRVDLESLLEEYQDVFARGPGDLGKTGQVSHEVQTQGRPIRQPFRRQPPGHREEERRQIGEMHRQGVIRPSQSPWSSPAVLVRKKNGSLRFCVDYRKLNAVTIKDAHPLPRIDDTLEFLHDCRYFSTLDLQKGYFQVPLREEDRKKTAFTTSSGELWEFNVLPMGVCNGPATFARLMGRVLDGLQWKTCIAYLDDVIVFAPTFDEHQRRLREVLTRLRQADLRLNPDKCVMGQTEVTFLGHVVSQDGLKVDPGKTRAIDLIPTPRRVRDVRSFLGLASYYRRFVTGFSTLAAPLNQLLEKPTTWHWTPECQAAFLELKHRLVSAPVMAYPNFHQPFTVSADASDHGLGAVLSQEQGGASRAIVYASRSLTKGERNYSATKKELLAIVWAVKKFRPYLAGLPFDIFTDHYSLQWLQQMEHGSALMHRWRNTLAEYDFTIHYRSGKRQSHVDGLSRLPLEEIRLVGPQVTPDGEPEPSGTPDEVEQTLSSGEAEQRELQALKAATTGGHWPQYLPSGWKTELKLHQGTIRNNEGTVILGPLAGLRVMKTLHDGPGCHPGVRKLTALFRERFWMPAARPTAQRVVRSCKGCQLGKDYGPRKVQQGQTGALRPWQVVAVDVVGPLPLSQGNKFIITFNDCFTRFVIAVPVADHCALTIARVMLQHVIGPYGLPEVVLSDRGREFTGNLWHELSLLIGFHLQHTSPYHPQTNGLCERAHRTINNALRATLSLDPQYSWPDLLPMVLLTMNAAPSDATSFSPYQLLFGRPARLPIEQQFTATPPSEVEGTANHRYLQGLHTALRKAQEEVRKQVTITIPRINPHSVGSKILVKVMPVQQQPKLSPRWEGPHVVSQVPNQFQVTYYTPQGLKRTVHVNDTKPFHEPLRNSMPESDLDRPAPTPSPRPTSAPNPPPPPCVQTLLC